MVGTPAVVSTALMTASGGRTASPPGGNCHRPLRRTDVVALVDVLDLLKAQLLLGDLDPDLVSRLSARLPDEPGAGPDSPGDGAADAPATSREDVEDRLLQALDGVAQRMRFALAEYDEPPSSIRPGP
jgi:hypothetical protein